MLTCHVFIATSLDGFIARRNGDIDWLTALPPDGGDYGYSAFLETMDGVIMGRATFEKVLTFGAWPFSKPVVVLSGRLKAGDLPAELAGKVRVFDGTPLTVADTLTSEGWRRAYVDGGRLIQSFLRAGLIADLVLSRLPVLLGDGLPLFGPLDNDLALAHIRTEAFESGLVQSQYRVK
ncbi:dihydrofolate reductase [Rhizobium sp. KVB221]|uniref:Dihydrofolate reductase n=1 Tax=Rhizobium setariae TaxID=2801340 RepID=A0A936YP59_9HYPH|nr:dihydrofolate reductase family protein [Rhizobium setariae]MBL0374110.1 dihydrofolate reductase [Rhizobium setariae]